MDRDRLTRLRIMYGFLCLRCITTPAWSALSRARFATTWLCSEVHHPLVDPGRGKVATATSSPHPVVPMSFPRGLALTIHMIFQCGDGICGTECRSYDPRSFLIVFSRSTNKFFLPSISQLGGFQLGLAFVQLSCIDFKKSHSLPHACLSQHPIGNCPFAVSYSRFSKHTPPARRAASLSPWGTRS